MPEKTTIIENGKVDWKAFLDLQSRHKVGTPTQADYVKAVTELLNAGVFSVGRPGNYACTAGGGALLVTPVGPPIYFTRRSDAEEYSALRWPQLEKEKNVFQLPKPPNFSD